MNRRKFIQGAAAGGILAAIDTPAQATTAAKYRWKMITAWPKNFPALGTGANRLAELITSMSNGRIEVKVYGAGELVPAFEVFDTVSRGTAELGHAGAYYWKGKSEATQFFASLPFGMTPVAMDAWLKYGGGMELWRELYADFGLIPAAAGNSGQQMAGWFNKRIASVEDLKGLKMRIPGLGGEVLKRAGGTPVTLAGGDLFTALKTGTIDATEWVGPYNDMAFGLHKAAKYYYYPGWHEPGTTLECMINKKAYETLPKDLQAIVMAACAVVNHEVLIDLTSGNAKALQRIKKTSVEVLKLPDDALLKLKGLSQDVVREIGAKSPFNKRVLASLDAFRKPMENWSDISDLAYLQARKL